MVKVFKYRGRTYSMSDVNDRGEYVVVKLSKDNKVESAKIIPGKSEKHVETMIKTNNFENFKNLPGA